MRKRAVRKLVNGVGTAGLVAGVAAAPFMPTANLASVCLAASTFAGRMAVVGFLVSISNNCPTNAAALFGVCTMVSQLVAVAAQSVAQALLEATGTFESVFF